MGSVARKNTILLASIGMASLSHFLSRRKGALHLLEAVLDLSQFRSYSSSSSSTLFLPLALALALARIDHCDRVIG